MQVQNYNYEIYFGYACLATETATFNFLINQCVPGSISICLFILQNFRKKYRIRLKNRYLLEVVNGLVFITSSGKKLNLTEM